jgi:ankyrin repeat protein
MATSWAEAALDALMRDPTLADAKTEQGVSVVNRNHELVKLLLRHGADPKLANEKGASPIDLAREAGDAALLGLPERT